MKYVGAEPVSRLAMAVKPRYHFAGKHHRFYERTPYRLGMCIISLVPRLLSSHARKPGNEASVS